VVAPRIALRRFNQDLDTGLLADPDEVALRRRS
jgi:hypothetical protein